MLLRQLKCGAADGAKGGYTTGSSCERWGTSAIILSERLQRVAFVWPLQRLSAAQVMMRSSYTTDLFCEMMVL